MNGKILSLMMTILITTAAFAGCTGDDDPLDESDGGYTYASNVDEHRKVVEDVCEIKEAAEAHDWDEVNEHYTAPSHSSKVLHDFASATGKKHGYDTYYTSTDTPMDDFVSAAIGGTGMFSGESSSVREQAVEKGVQNWIMVAYAVHELNAAISKANDGNFDDDSGAPHAWDEGWAFYHGLDEYSNCSPYATGDKRAANFGTAASDGTANANAAILKAMNDGLTSLQDTTKTDAQRVSGAETARDDIVKNLVIIYSQASIRYASKMSSDMASGDSDAADTHQAEGMAFWKVIEQFVGPYTSICYNMMSHTVSGDSTNASCEAYMYVENYTMQDGSSFTGCYNTISHSTDGNMSKSECESFGWYANYYSDKINSEVYDISTVTPAADVDYKKKVEDYLQPAWDHYGITASDIGTLQ
jgi:hypothetical protein